MTSSSLYPRNRIAVIWDFDKTLIRGHMQAPLFAHFGVDEETFWQEANGYAEFFRARGLSNFASDTYYLQHILTYVRAGRFPGLNNALLRELGKELPFFPGLARVLPTSWPNRSARSRTSNDWASSWSTTSSAADCARRSWARQSVRW